MPAGTSPMLLGPMLLLVTRLPLPLDKTLMHLGYTLWPLLMGQLRRVITPLPLGVIASAAGDNAFAFGKDASADFLNSQAFGNGATATQANQIVLGTASNTYTFAGIASAASTAAQGTVDGLVTTDASG